LIATNLPKFFWKYYIIFAEMFQLNYLNKKTFELSQKLEIKIG